MFTREKTFTVYEKPEASDPADRMVLLREGFSFWAFMFTLFWLIYKRMWLVAVYYLVAAGAVMLLVDAWAIPEPYSMLAQLWLQLMLAYHAYDLQGWWLTRRGHRFAGVLVAESEMQAERRYHEFAA